MSKSARSRQNGNDDRTHRSQNSAPVRRSCCGTSDPKLRRHNEDVHLTVLDGITADHEGIVPLERQLSAGRSNSRRTEGNAGSGSRLTGTCRRRRAWH